jgi:hypothetical protein
MKTLSQSPAKSTKPQIARSKSGVFVRLRRLALWSVIGIISLAAVGATYQIIATEMDI